MGHHNFWLSQIDNTRRITRKHVEVVQGSGNGGDHQRTVLRKRLKAMSRMVCTTVQADFIKLRPGHWCYCKHSLACWYWQYIRQILILLSEKSTPQFVSVGLSQACPNKTPGRETCSKGRSISHTQILSTSSEGIGTIILSQLMLTN